MVMKSPAGAKSLFQAVNGPIGWVRSRSFVNGFVGRWWRTGPGGVHRANGKDDAAKLTSLSTNCHTRGSFGLATVNKEATCVWCCALIQGLSSAFSQAMTAAR